MFDIRSKRRKCGVAYIVRQIGHAVPGIVFDIDDAGRDTLSRKEGVEPYGPGTYTPRNVVALLEEPSGMTAPATRA
jgi:hypothetical protein